VKVSDSDLSQRRAAAGVGVFEAIVRAALRPLARLEEHPRLSPRRDEKTIASKR
jgi:hypothetical protein